MQDLFNFDSNILEYIILPVMIAALLLEFIDIILGMGYGTIMSPVLLLLGFSPLDIIPALLVVNVAVGIVAGIFHQFFGNMNLKNFGEDFKISMIISSFGIIGVFGAVLIAIRIPEQFIILYISILAIAFGIGALFKSKTGEHLVWWKIILVGLFGAFNKGMSGGGYGQVVLSGQIIAGVSSKKAIAITAFSEGIISIAGALMYFYVESGSFRWDLIISLLIGSLAGIPLATFLVSKIESKKLKYLIAGACIGTGVFTLYKLF